MDSSWLRWIPRPAFGVPLLIGAIGVIAIATAALDLPRGPLTSMAGLLILSAARWDRAPSYSVGAAFGIAQVAIGISESRPPALAVAVTLIGTLAVMALWEVLRAMTRERERAVRSLAESENLYSRVLEAAHVIAYECERASGRVTFVGARLARMLGYTAAAEHGETGEVEFWLDRVHPEDRDSLLQRWRDLGQTDELDLEFRMLRGDGSLAWLANMATASSEPEATVQGVIVDITERKRAEQERRALEARTLEAQRLESLGMVARGVAHDLNNLLTVVLGNASIVREAMSAVDPLRANMDDQIAAAERAADLADQMLTYSGHAPIQTCARDVSKVVEETATLLASSISKNARLELDLARSVWAQIDAAQVHQVVMNLVVNASEALVAGGGTIIVRTRSEPRGGPEPDAVIEVIDDGHGMADADTPLHIFDPFFTTKGQGRGLGLAVVHGIVRGHGGEISVDSSAGWGTRVRIALPGCAAAEAEAAVSTAPDEEARPSARSTGGTVLVVDDEPNLRSVCCEALERAGFKTHQAESGEQALELLKKLGSVDAVVLDLTMPGLSGRETLQALWSREPTLPILQISGYAEQHAAAETRERPAFLKKPFTPRELVSHVSALLEDVA